MNLLSSFFILTALCLSLFSCKKGQALRFGGQDIFAFGAQDGCHFNRNQLGIRISWKGSMPLNLTIHRSVPSRYDNDIISAADRWNKATGKTLIVVRRDNSLSNPPGNDRQNMIYWMNTWDTDNSKEQARTTTSVDLSKLVDTDIKINGQNFLYALNTETVGSGAVDFESLLVHEMGHALGLQHFQEGSGVMDPYLPSGIKRTNISSYELSELSCEY